MKLAINMQVAAQEVAWGEGLALAEASGIDRSQAMAVMLGSVIASPMIKYRAPFVLQPPEEVWASAAQLRKDVAYAVERSGGRAIAGQHALDLLDRLCAEGRGDREAAELMVAAAEGESGANGKAKQR
jgi:3-hydroxyisobutyrate dehydrogenase-like beta-hydroxyacid dehydrogenase